MKGTLPHFSTTVSREHDVNYSEGPREVCSYSELGAASSLGHNGISVSVLSQHQLFSEQKSGGLQVCQSVFGCILVLVYIKVVHSFQLAG